MEAIAIRLEAIAIATSNNTAVFVAAKKIPRQAGDGRLTRWIWISSPRSYNSSRYDPQSFSGGKRVRPDLFRAWEIVAELGVVHVAELVGEKEDIPWTCVDDDARLNWIPMVSGEFARARSQDLGDFGCA